MARTLLVGQSITLAVEGRNAQEQKARLPARPTWAVVPPGYVTLTVAGDGLTCGVLAVSPGDCVVTVTSGTLAPVDDAISVLPSAATHVVIYVP